MDKKSTLIIALVILGGMFGFVVVAFQALPSGVVGGTNNIASSTAWENTPAVKPIDIHVTPKTIVTAKHRYDKGVHSFAGEILMPTPCHILEHDVYTSANNDQISIAFTSSIKNNDVCAQTITPARFKFSIRATKDALILTILNGQEVGLNLIDVDTEDEINEFELYIKG